MQQCTTPLFDALLDKAGKNLASFHVPGHKSGQGLPVGAEVWFDRIMQLDMTEITGLDYLHQAEGVIDEAQRLAAAAFGADYSFFLVGGSTAGNVAMILSLCGPGDTLLVQRDVHQSVLHGLMLAGAKAVFLQPRADERFGLSLGVDAEVIEAALLRYPDAKGVFLTNPSYYGIVADLSPIAEVVHAFGKPLLIDEAHGAHFGFHPRLPLSALQCGADAVVQSTHKMLNAMTMGSMLHIQSERMDRDKIQKVLGMIQSSSPSYPIMASLDLARRDMAIHGQQRIDQALKVVDQVLRQLRSMPWFGTVKYTARSEDMQRVLMDPFKLPIYDRTGTFSGYELQQQLEQRGCMVELSDSHYVLLVFSPFSSPEDGTRLIDTLAQISDDFALKQQEPSAKKANINMLHSTTLISQPVPLSLSFHSSREAVPIPLEQCVGTRCGEMLIPYPPGIPILLPGELITQAAVDAIRSYRQAGIRLHGAKDPTLDTIMVYEAEHSW